MTTFTIKIIAYITMFLDHIKYVYPESSNFITMYFGRISFPLFAFLLTEGYVHTSDLYKYSKKLVIFAVISQIPFMIFRTFVGNYLMLNIMVTLLLGLLTIIIYDKVKNKILSRILIFSIVILGELLSVDYGAYGVLMIFVLYLFKSNKIILTIGYVLLVVGRYYLAGYLNIVHMYNVIFSILPLIIILLYNGKEGKKLGSIYYYWIYPIHMIIFSIIGYLAS